MAKRVQILGHGSVEAVEFVGLSREITVDTGLSTVRVHDGVTEGGTPLAKQSLADTPNATANNAGRMSAQQAADLAQALLDIGVNANNINLNAAAINVNAAAINVNAAALNTKVDHVSGIAGHAAVLAGDGNLVSAGFAPDAGFTAGTRAVFVQAAAPTGWQIDGSLTDRMLRITNTGGGNIGGSWTFAGLTIFPHTLTIAELPAHSHPIQEAGNQYLGTPSSPYGAPNTSGGAGFKSFAAATGNTGAGTGHAHTWGHDGQWRPSYVNASVCIKL